MWTIELLMFVIAVDTAAGLPKFEADSALPPGGRGGMLCGSFRTTNFTR